MVSARETSLLKWISIKGEKTGIARAVGSVCVCVRRVGRNHHSLSRQAHIPCAHIEVLCTSVQSSLKRSVGMWANLLILYCCISGLAEALDIVLHPCLLRKHSK